LVGLAFFYPGSIDEVVDACIDLALVFKCNPFSFLEMPEREVMELYRLTAERLKQMRSE
jgi:hypothetical protein